MKIGPWEFTLRKAAHDALPAEKAARFEDVLSRIIAVQTGMGAAVTPENCMRSPTVHAIVTAASRRMSVTPVHIYRTSVSKGRMRKEQDRSHPVARLLQYPNEWQTRVNFWADAASCFVRHGKFYAFKSRGLTGPIRSLVPLHANAVTPKQDDNYRVHFEVREQRGAVRELTPDKILHARGPSRDFLEGDSPINDVRQAIALEIAAEEFGANFFNNGALPLLVFTYMQGSAGFKTPEQEKQFIEDVRAAVGGKRTLRNLFLPKGIDKPTPVQVEHDKAQFLETRKYQRTVIAGAFGVPPHLVGDLERATFNNVEQQDHDFAINVVMPIVQAFESAMERDLLTDDDWRSGTIIRFNMDAVLRADLATRTNSYSTLRQWGVLSANEIREREGLNPISEDKGGEDYLRPGNMFIAGEADTEPSGMDDLDKSIARLRETLASLQG